MGVTPTDGIDSGAPVVTGPVTIVNTPPAAPVVLISPASPTTDDALTCSITAASADPDADDGVDIVSYDFSWFEGATHQPAYDVLYADASGTSVVPSSATEAGETWTLETFKFTFGDTVAKAQPLVGLVIAETPSDLDYFNRMLLREAYEAIRDTGKAAGAEAGHPW